MVWPLHVGVDAVFALSEEGLFTDERRGRRILVWRHAENDSIESSDSSVAIGPMDIVDAVEMS